MAEIRPAGAPVANLPTAPHASARAQAVRTAQAAFFQAALAGETSAPALSRVSPAPPVTAVSPGRAFDPEAPAPSRLLRPGSLVDLKV